MWIICMPNLNPIRPYIHKVRLSNALAVALCVYLASYQTSRSPYCLWLETQLTLIWHWGRALKIKWALTCDFQQCGILTSVDSDKPLQSSVELRNPKWCSVRSLTLIDYSSDSQRLWPDCAYAQADLRQCWSHIPHCWKSHIAAQMSNHIHFSMIIAHEAERTNFVADNVW